MRGKIIAVFAVGVVALCITATTVPAQAQGSHRVSIDGDGGQDPICQVINGVGTCTNNGHYVHGWLYGCETDFNGDYHYATIHADQFYGSIVMAVLQPIHAHQIFYYGGKPNYTHRLWTDFYRISGNAIEWAIATRAGFPGGSWIQRAHIECCSCGSDKMSHAPPADLPAGVRVKINYALGA